MSTKNETRDEKMKTESIQSESSVQNQMPSIWYT
jgi:hypothetical protein